MISKIAETHFDAMLAASYDGIPSTQGTSPTTHEALNTFLSAPSFSTKQIAIESLLKQITQSSNPGTI